MYTPSRIDPRRVRELATGDLASGPVVYWMSRDQRVHDNWALLHAQDIALSRQVPLVVVFSLSPKFLGATIRQYDFMFKGLREIESELERFRIRFVLMLGAPGETIVRFVRKVEAGVLVTDFSPLRIARRWRQEVAGKVGIPVYEVDAHNIVPCWAVSEKREYAAYTLRPKIKRQLDEFLTELPPVRVHDPAWTGKRLTPADWETADVSLRVNRSVEEVSWLEPGEDAARQMLDHFLVSRLASYDHARNDPTAHAQSMLSPYLHFGHISAQRVALEVQPRDKNFAAQEAFLEELIVRRELADNFCYHEPAYDEFGGFPEWAQRSLNEHRSDPRDYVYSEKQFEDAETHDELWNAAQKEMVVTGKMHGYMRMYWAKKILEWSPTPEEALKTANWLNDKYELDGRDPNGYTGVAWSIGGVHDRPWFERPIFGKIRYMSAGGCARKFDVTRYIERAGRAAGETTP